MGSILSNVYNVILQQDPVIFVSSLLLSSLIAIIIIMFIRPSLYLRSILKRFFRILIHKRLMNPKLEASDDGPFVSYYRNYLCNMQKINNEELAKILQKNHSSAFCIDRSISFLNSHRPSSAISGDEGYTSIDQFREKIPLTTYEDYRSYIDRIVVGGEKNLLSSDKIIYFNTSSGTTAKIKLIPTTKAMLRKIMMIARAGNSVAWRSLQYPSPEQRPFLLQNGKKSEKFERSKDGIPIGSLTQCFSVISPVPGMRTLISASNILSLDLVERITDFETSTFVQLAFALAVPDVCAYTVSFAPGFIHTIKIIENYFEEISLCISSVNFNHSSLVKNNIHDSKLRADLNRALNEITIEYGGMTYRLERANHIRKECLKKDIPGLLHRLWPTLIYASTAIGGTFVIFKEEIQFYCGEKLPLINFLVYAASEGFFGIPASIHTDEYFLSPTSAFFEFIKEEDMHQTQPKTVLLSDIEPGNRYELVCTTEPGLVRYRMGDIINCTRFLSRADDLVPLPSEPVEIPRIPLISIAYRIGNLLDVYGEKTTEHHVMNALQQAVCQWKEQGISVNIGDFTSYPKVDVFPAHYVIFLELIGEQNDEQLQMLQKIANSEVERQLCITNEAYKRSRTAEKLGPLCCILVQNGTFSTFINKELLASGLSPVQVKPRRLLNKEQHMQFFYKNRIFIVEI